MREPNRLGGVRAGGIALGLALALACGGTEPEEPAAVPGETAASEPESPERANAPPRVEWVRLEPSRPVPNSRVRVFARAEDPDGDAVRLEYRWRVAGQEVGTGDSLVLRDVQRGDPVEVLVTATDGQAQSTVKLAQARVSNQPPLLSGVALEAPDGLAAGARIVASPQAVDADGDDLRFDYTWRVNGDRVPVDGPVLETNELRRGDVVEVTVVARDGYEESEPRSSDPVTLGNTAPRIVSSPSWKREGDTFRYQVEARDPDGDRTLRYRLQEGPPGMQVDALAGVVTWTPEPDQEGTHPVEIEVDDLHGGRSAQRFEVVMESERGASQPPAAAAPSY